MVPELPEVTELPMEETREPEVLILDLTGSLSPQLPVVPDSGEDASEPPPGSRSERDERKRTRGEGIRTAPPNADEWNKFLALTVLRLVTEGYLYMVLFKDIDESMLTSHERELISLSKEDLLDITAPVSVVVSRQKIARKHGRELIALADSFESILDLFVWMRRVNKIARRYRASEPPQQAQADYIEGTIVNGQVPGQNQAGPIFPGFAGGRG